ncbi:MAG: class I SAM-dependent methyltransferase [Rhodospirillaceae bacterium]|jgi:ubiquinone/menaquinone biosynthesis C-methylase UbiE|nr:class I SAM-dependent methyltransferase [Rhodospirillaceae bacterium]
MLDRRTLFGAAAGVGTAVSSFITGNKAQAGTNTRGAPDVEARGARGRLERLPTLDAENRDDFLTGFRNWRGSTVARAAKKRADRLIEASGNDPKKEIPLDEALELFKDDPLVGTEGLMRVYSQRMAHRNFFLSFADDVDTYLGEMEAYDDIGPGTLTLNPDLDIPDFAKHEIHMQPGGYVGNAFAGHLYHYGTNAFYSARATDNYQDQHHARLAEQVPTPEDGKVKRILDMGCGIGQFSVALKERYPNAEIWGVEVGGPMIRYGHMRAVDQGVDVNFVQGLAENTDFPDNHFDLVVSYILHHEIPADTSRAVFAEAQRVLRPGGLYFPIDFYTGGMRGVPGAYSQYQEWKDHRWNNEVWRMEYKQMDFAGDMEKAGFDVNKEGSPAWYSNRNIFGTKRA